MLVTEHPFQNYRLSANTPYIVNENISLTLRTYDESLYLEVKEHGNITIVHANDTFILGGNTFKLLPPRLFNFSAPQNEPQTVCDISIVDNKLLQYT